MTDQETGPIVWLTRHTLLEQLQLSVLVGIITLPFTYLLYRQDDLMSILIRTDQIPVYETLFGIISWAESIGIHPFIDPMVFLPIYVILMLVIVLLAIIDSVLITAIVIIPGTIGAMYYFSIPLQILYFTIAAIRNHLRKQTHIQNTETE